jgi:hypothetical protein
VLLRFVAAGTVSPELAPDIGPFVPSPPGPFGGFRRRVGDYGDRPLLGHGLLYRMQPFGDRRLRRRHKVSTRRPQLSPAERQGSAGGRSPGQARCRVLVCRRAGARRLYLFRLDGMERRTGESNPERCDPRPVSNRLALPMAGPPCAPCTGSNRRPPARQAGALPFS